MDNIEEQIKYEKQIKEKSAQTTTLSSSVYHLITHLLKDRKFKKISNLYKNVLNLIEPPMLDAIMAFTRYNQSRAAKILGLSRNTLRRKLIEHFGDKYCTTREEDNPIEDI